jgi:hypothetical protein
MMRELIDGVATASKSNANTVEVNSSLYISPGQSRQTKDLVKRYLAYQMYRGAYDSSSLWYALYNSGMIAEGATPSEAAAKAYSLLGFVPVSADGSVYRYDRKYDEVIHQRIGSRRSPAPEPPAADDTPLNKLFETLRWLRADLRFREDGIHTVVTLGRSGREK